MLNKYTIFGSLMILVKIIHITGHFWEHWNIGQNSFLIPKVMMKISQEINGSENNRFIESKFSFIMSYLIKNVRDVPKIFEPISKQQVVSYILCVSLMKHLDLFSNSVDNRFNFLKNQSVLRHHFLHKVKH